MAPDSRSHCCSARSALFGTSLHGRGARLCRLMILQRRCTAHADRADEFATDDDRIDDFWRTALCPLLAQSGHFTTEFQCPLSGVKRTSSESASMSANDPKRSWALRVLAYPFGL